MGFLIFGVAVVAIVVAAIFATRMQEIAEQKGYKGRVWAWCFWIPIYGALMVNAIPDERLIEALNRMKNIENGEKESTQDSDELPEL